MARITRARQIVEDAVTARRAVYGINTGIGDLATVRIDPAEARALQSGLLRSHATAVGPALSRVIVRAMLLLKARTFSLGHSGVRPDVVERLVEFLNRGVHPVVPAQGSLGASGDLAPLAHLALPLIGEGSVEHNGRVKAAAAALRELRLEPLELSHKEGLSLVNGTELMLASGLLALDDASRIARSADIAGAMSVEACLGTDAVFADDVVSLRKHPGANVVAGNIRRLLDGSAIVRSHRESEHLVQDAYSLRCIPQVHGAYRDAMRYVRATLEAELESAIDNPSILPDTNAVVSSGNFHGEALGLALDHLTLCVAGYATIAERRVARIVDPSLNNGLPAFLTADPGRRSGFMIAHYTAAALVSENRALCWPASADSIPTSAGQEDHVSMGATSARKARGVVENTQRVIAVEALAAAQGLDLRPLAPAPGTGAARQVIRALSPHLEEDRPLSDDIETVRVAIADGSFIKAVEDEVGPLD
jgi:histidine ammonia-lyase